MGPRRPNHAQRLHNEPHHRDSPGELRRRGKGHPEDKGHGTHRSKSRRQESTESPGFVLSKILRALLGRLLFVVHSLVTIWQSVEVYQNPAYWSFALISVAILIEGAFTILQRAGDERKWFCPSVLLFVLATTPPIWLLELDLSHKRLLALTRNGTVAIQSIGEVEHTLRISHELWIQLLEQFMLVILIVGRWMLPKGDITREQLSQILLAYLAIASDIVELFDVFKERPVTIYSHLRYLVLTTWSISLVQFGFVLTTSKARKMRVAITHDDGHEDMKRIHARLTGAPTSIINQATRHIHTVDDNYMKTAGLVGTQENLNQWNRKSRGVNRVLFYDRYHKNDWEEDARKLYKHYRKSLSTCKESMQQIKDAYPYVVPVKHSYERHTDKVYREDDDDDKRSNSVYRGERSNSTSLRVPPSRQNSSPPPSPRRRDPRDKDRDRRRLLDDTQARSPRGRRGSRQSSDSKPSREIRPLSPPPQKRSPRPKYPEDTGRDKERHRQTRRKDHPHASSSGRQRMTTSAYEDRGDRSEQYEGEYYHHNKKNTAGRAVRVHGQKTSKKKEEERAQDKKRHSFSHQSTYSL